ncbi:hypothetical protein CEXT_373371 [Caerostris extrusa]|uniref:Uncharacterized protein n=1 Tax=Caerostris extrusa TaxID=172846 RepID=A0AAV4S4T9_CAEEX|nr:hypothetical protein CEXT_373371 [Caerostris extrusa]
MDENCERSYPIANLYTTTWRVKTRRGSLPTIMVKTIKKGLYKGVDLDLLRKCGTLIVCEYKITLPFDDATKMISILCEVS